ncbi:MAG: LPXTG cell wall anchor domain-containing protein [Chloroflexi bacterium]|nr:LPXTG cell wall anchor domain-containing protein [Chloroflexota bacterium]
MTDLNDNQFEDFEEENPASPEDSGRPAGNRNFIIAIGVLGGISLLILIILILLGLFILPAQSKARKEQALLVNTQNTATSQAATQIAAQKALATATPTATPTATAIPSATPVVAIATATATPQGTGTAGPPAIAQDLSARTQTVAALLTQAAGGNGTATATPRTTALPTTGFADEVGLPVLLGLALLLIVVIFVVRRVRLSSSS